MAAREHLIDIAVRLTPRAAADAIVPGADGKLAVRVTAPPVEGRANEALCRLIAKRAGVPRSRVAVVRGEKSREKVVRIEAADPAAVRASLGLPAR